jgi:hypothetical protein
LTGGSKNEIAGIHTLRVELVWTVGIKTKAQLASWPALVPVPDVGPSLGLR